MRISFVYRSPSYRRDRLTLTCRAITSTGITPRKKAIPALPFSPKNEPLCVSYGIGIEERYFYSDAEGIYSWWSYRFKACEKNAGWRIDYFITSKRINDKLKKAAIHTDVLGSDHCPVEVDIEF